MPTIEEGIHRGARATSIHRHLVLGVAGIAVLFGGMGTWAATTEIAGAVIASGHVVVASSVKTIQHPTGGIVGEILVSDGERVVEGQPLLRLDPTQAAANLAILVKSLEEMQARQARLEAERDDASEIRFKSDTPSEIVAGETRLFSSRRTGRDGQKLQLRERILQLREEAKGMDVHFAAKSLEGELVENELKGVKKLFGKGVVALTRLTDLQRTSARIAGDLGQIKAGAAQVRGRIAEVELQILQVDQDLRSSVLAELSELRARIGEIGERKTAAIDQLNRIVLRSPLSGTVHEVSVHTVGAVIQSGEKLMQIVPNESELSIEARIFPHDVDRITVGHEALLRFSAFDQRTTPEIMGTVEFLAPAASVGADHSTFYTVRIGFNQEEEKRLGSVRLMPGMPVEAFLRTGNRTVGSYLLKPLTDQIGRAFREE